MDWITIAIFAGIAVSIVFVIIMEMFKGKSEAVVKDSYGREFRRRARKLTKSGSEKVAFKYNAASKAGVAIEGNKTVMGKKSVFHYIDADGTLIPSNTKVQDKIAELKLATSQEKLYETDALKSVTDKIDETFWEKNKHMIMAGFIVAIAGLVSIVMVSKAMTVQPVPEPQIQMFNQMTGELRKVSDINQKVLEQCLQNTTETQQEVNRTNVPR